jgi:spore coat protein U domain-containing protein, fimbrial subunit CupE1/2/3/6
MNIRAMRSLFVLLVIACGMAWAVPARATIACSAVSMGPVSFGTVNPLSSLTQTTSTLSYTCKNSTGGGTHSATVCFSIGEPGGAQTNPRLMSSGANSLQFQLYWGTYNGTIWGSQYFGSATPLMVNITLASGASTSGATATLFAQVLNGQTTALPGNYADNYANGDTAVTVNDATGTTAPGSCGGTEVTNLFFPFNVTATVQKNCSVSANNLSLGTVAAGTVTPSGNSTLSVTCTLNTPYYIGMAPQNVTSTTGVGTMKGTGTNTDTVTYQLYSNSGLSTIWGNTATTTTVGNGVSGSGTGVPTTLTVYAKATGSTDVKPDSYSDTVQVNINY